MDILGFLGGPNGKEPTCLCRKLNGQETRVWFLGQEDLLEEGMTTYSNILGWRIPWTGEPGGPQSMGSQRVSHNWSNLSHTHTHTHTHTHGHIIAQLNLVPVLFIIAGWIFTFLNNRFLWHCEVCGLLFRMIFFYTCTQSSMYLLATMPCVLQTLEISQMTGPWELLIQLRFVAHSHIHNQGQSYASVRGEWK